MLALINKSKTTVGQLMLFSCLLIAVKLSGCKLADNKTANQTDTEISASAMEDFSVQPYYLIELNLRAINSNLEGIFIKMDKETAAVTGNAGCNTFRAKLEKESKGLKMGRVASTRKSCPKLAIEQEVLSTFDQADYFVLEGGELVFYKGREVVMKWASIE